MDILRIDCNTCPVAGRGCHDCLVGALLASPTTVAAPPIAEDELTPAEGRAWAMFAAAGMLALEEHPEVVIRPAPLRTARVLPLRRLRQAQ